MILDKYKVIYYTLIVTFWVRCTFGFISGDLIPALSSASSAVFFLADIVLIFLGLCVIRNKYDIIFAATFIGVGGFVTCIHNGYSLMFFLNGLRDFIYILFLIPLFRFFYQSSHSEEFIRKFDKHLFIFLVLQAFCITFQFLKYGANDHGGGSMGNGYSGIISTLIYLISFYLLKKRMDEHNYFASLVANKWLIILLYPTFLNETKISFIFLIMYFVLLLPLKKDSFIKLFFLSPILLAASYLLFYWYKSATGANDEVLSLDYYWETYLMAGDNNDIIKWAEYLYENEELDSELSDIPRFTKFILIPELNDSYPGHDITGYGIGQFKGGTTVDNSRFYKENEWMLRGSIPYGFHFYIQLGLLSIPFFIWFWIRLYKMKEPGTYQDYSTQLYILFLALLFMFYNDFFRYSFVCIVYFYVFLQSIRGNSTRTKYNDTNSALCETY